MSDKERKCAKIDILHMILQLLFGLTFYFPFSVAWVFTTAFLVPHLWPCCYIG